ncbi:hypothetical protein Aperf_G00000011351 [Anoplocephala perfoliata]
MESSLFAASNHLFLCKLQSAISTSQDTLPSLKLPLTPVSKAAALDSNLSPLLLKLTNVHAIVSRCSNAKTGLQATSFANFRATGAVSLPCQIYLFNFQLRARETILADVFPQFRRESLDVVVDLRRILLPEEGWITLTGLKMTGRKTTLRGITHRIRNITKLGFEPAMQNASLSLADADRRLLETRKHFKSQIAASKKKREDLEVRQADLQQLMDRFESFIHDNEAKRTRAINKYLIERQMIEEKTIEGIKLRGDFGKAKLAYENMKRKVDEYRKYESYLMQVIDLLPADYIKIADNPLVGLIMRYNTLSGTYQSLLTEMNIKSENIREVHSQLQALREEHASRILTLNSQLADLYKERAVKSERIQQNAQQFDQDLKEMRNQEYITTMRMILAALNTNKGERRA